jgi:hypothetical protein
MRLKKNENGSPHFACMHPLILLYFFIAMHKKHSVCVSSVAA